MNLKKKTLKGEIDNFIFDWSLFPLDYWWRKKYNVPFGSQRHREMNFIDMAIEWNENAFMKKVFEEKDEDDIYENEKLLLGTGQEIVKPTEQEIDEDYENLDLEQFNTK